MDHHTVHSPALEGNHLGDPTDRPLWVYVPPGYDAEPDRRYPTVYVIQGYGSFVSTWANRSWNRSPYPEMVDRLFAGGAAPPCVVVFVDAWTTYGGSQFVDSPGTGRYHSYLCDDVVPFVDRRYRTLAAPAHRALQGKSSGGFGAMITPMLRPDLFGALATHAGDALYELLYLPEFAKAVRSLRRFDGSVADWWADFGARPAHAQGEDLDLLMIYGVAACFSPADDGTPVLPFDTASGRLREDVWARWMDWDPVRMVARHADALRGLTAIWVDGGRSDQYFLELGAVAFRDALAEVGVTGTVHFELFDGTHSNIDWRYPISLSWLAERLSP
ncbi:MAG: alpha/beta hydrolase-fold protein [Actinomycetota bacterium]|nr:alpha/beta hydrolase-fold protein [Actinomycetota bacterium]